MNKFNGNYFFFFYQKFLLCFAEYNYIGYIKFG